MAPEMFFVFIALAVLFKAAKFIFQMGARSNFRVESPEKEPSARMVSPRASPKLSRVERDITPPRPVAPLPPPPAEIIRVATPDRSAIMELAPGREIFIRPVGALPQAQGAKVPQGFTSWEEFDRPTLHRLTLGKALRGRPI